MVFTSIEFLVFLPIVFFIYWFVVNRNTRLQNAFIVLASYVFYGWWDMRFLTLIVFTSFCSYGSGLLIERYRGTPKAKWFHIGNIAVNLGILVLFKYYNFFVTSFADLFLGGETDGLLLRIILPVGISFYTFQAIGYTTDVYRNQIKPTSDIIRFFAFISFFPQLVAGPIERASHLLPQFEKPRVFNYEQATDGMRQILWGLFKKVVADRCAVVVNEVFGNYTSYSGSMLLVAAILFSFQIYGDFSGYSDMAIGIAKLFGITLKKNFNVPFFSRNVSEYWRRWHISLTTWFRDYVYIPLGGSRGSKAMIIRNTFIVFILSGFWHGASWAFLVWGAYNAALFIPMILKGKKRNTGTVAEGRWLPNVTELFSMVFTFFLFVFGRIIYRVGTLGQAVDYIGRMFHWETIKAGYYIFRQEGISVFLIVLLLVEWFQRTAEHGLEFHRPIKWPVRYAIYIVFVLILIFYWGENQQYIYFQF